MRARITGLLITALLLTGCGGSDDGSSVFPTDTDTDTGVAADQPASDAAPDTAGDGDTVLGDAGEIEPEASGPLAMDTIRVGSEVWERTLPMTTGQCYLFEDDGTLPTSANVWGTLDGTDDVRFSATMNQDGEFSSEISNNADMFWVAGARIQRDDLDIQLDFANQTVTGSGVFVSLTNGRLAEGSFAFTCTETE